MDQPRQRLPSGAPSVSPASAAVPAPPPTGGVSSSSQPASSSASASALASSSTMKRPVKFVASDEDGLPLKRRQVQHACDSCRKKKKRCPHGPNSSGYSFIVQDGPAQGPAWPGHSALSPSSVTTANTTGVGTSQQHQHQHQHQHHHQQHHQQQQQQQPRPSESSSTSSRLPLSPTSPADHADDVSSTALVASQLVELSASRFVGDLSPESVFIEATNKHSTDSRLHRNRSDVGKWIRETPRRSSSNHDNGPSAPSLQRRDNADPAARDTAHRPDLQHHQPLSEAGSSKLLTLSGRINHDASSPRGREPSAAQRPYLAVVPPDRDYQRLCSIYLDQIHPILPVLKECDVLATVNTPSQHLSVRQTILKQLIALAAAVEPSASPYLRLQSQSSSSSSVNSNSSPSLLDPQTFHRRLSTAIFTAVDANLLLVSDKTDHIRALCLLFFFFQPRRASERDISPFIFSQAVHYSQTQGIHLREVGRSLEDEDAEVLFCVLWALDRISAAFHGRPCLLHMRDTDRELDECIARQESAAFRLFLGVVSMLDRVIHLYRPHNEGVESVEMPVFESIIIEAGAEKLSSRLISTIEIFYHAVSVLSCRQSCSTPTAVPAPSAAHLPQPNINARRSYSADRIVDAVSSYLTAASAAAAMSSSSSSTYRPTITILPFVPYAVALSLSVIYRKMRYSRIPMYRARGRQRFQEIVALLQTLGELYTGAKVNAALGTAILREMDKTAKELANAGTQDSGNTPIALASSPRIEEGETGGASVVPQQQADARTVVGRSREFVGSALTPRMGVDQHQQSPQQQADGLMAGAHHHHQQAVPSVGMSMAGGAGSIGQAWGSLSDVDLFVHFDPGFDLSAVDAALEANLDMGYPQLWTTSGWPE